jgi:hypothetical protein
MGFLISSRGVFLVRMEGVPLEKLTKTFISEELSMGPPFMEKVHNRGWAFKRA